MRDESLVITPALGATQVQAATEARIKAACLLVSLGAIKTVGDRIDADDAVVVMREAKEFSDLVEKERIAAKAPALDISRKIDALAKELTADINGHLDRVGRLAGAFEAKERQAAAERQREADRVAAKLAFDAAQAERAAIKAAPTAEAAARASDKIVGAAQVAIAEVRATAAPAPKAAGTQVRKTVCFEVTDIKALHAWQPEMVTMEPNGPLLRAQIAATPDIVIPGVRHWIEEKLNVR